MDEMFLNDDVKEFFASIKELAELDEDMLDEESTTQLITLINNSLKGSAARQAINQIVNNLEIEGASRQEAQEAIDALKNYINETVYGDQVLTGNKKKVIDAVLNSTYSIFDTAMEKYNQVYSQYQDIQNTINNAKDSIMDKLN